MTYLGGELQPRLHMAPLRTGDGLVTVSCEILENAEPADHSTFSTGLKLVCLQVLVEVRVHAVLRFVLAVSPFSSKRTCPARRGTSRLIDAVGGNRNRQIVERRVTAAG